MAGKLYLIPTTLGSGPSIISLPAMNLSIIKELKHFIVEEFKSARRFLKSVDKNIDIDALHFYVLNEHTRTEEIPGLLNMLKDGNDAGLLSEAGLPCVADPGAQLVSAAQKINIIVVPLSGPSSIFLALMASGFNGQNFAFRGYLPIDRGLRVKMLKELESDVFRKDQTQIFIEAPYRNQQLLEAILNTCGENMMLCLAAELMSPQEKIFTKSIRDWKRQVPDIRKKPAVFLLYK